VDIYIEQGNKRAFAGAIEWPGWCRAAKDEAGAIDALMGHALRYADVVRDVSPAFGAPKASSLEIVDRLRGGSTTDFGAPEAAPAADARPVSARELSRLVSILGASWGALDRAAAAAPGDGLRAGPRGGGRDLRKILGHVVGAEAAYLRHLGEKGPVLADDPVKAAAALRPAVIDALERAVTQGLPEAGPRGGKIWSPRFWVRRSTWHVLDHAWEIEDRSAIRDGIG
jgi:hypothetical protein